MLRRKGGQKRGLELVFPAWIGQIPGKQLQQLWQRNVTQRIQRRPQSRKSSCSALQQLCRSGRCPAHSGFHAFRKRLERCGSPLDQALDPGQVVPNRVAQRRQTSGSAWCTGLLRLRRQLQRANCSSRLSRTGEKAGVLKSEGKQLDLRTGRCSLQLEMHLLESGQQLAVAKDDRQGQRTQLRKEKVRREDPEDDLRQAGLPRQRQVVGSVAHLHDPERLLQREETQPTAVSFRRHSSQEDKVRQIRSNPHVLRHSLRHRNRLRKLLDPEVLERKQVPGKLDPPDQDRCRQRDQVLVQRGKKNAQGLPAASAGQTQFPPAAFGAQVVLQRLLLALQKPLAYQRCQRARIIAREPAARQVGHAPVHRAKHEFQQRQQFGIQPYFFGHAVDLLDVHRFPGLFPEQKPLVRLDQPAVLDGIADVEIHPFLRWDARKGCGFADFRNLGRRERPQREGIHSGRRCCQDVGSHVKSSAL